MTVSDDRTRDGDHAPSVDPERDVAVPDGAPVHACVYCDRPFSTERSLALHRGLAHGERLTTAEREAYDGALADERDDLRHFRLVALAALVLVYFGFLFTYAFVT